MDPLYLATSIAGVVFLAGTVLVSRYQYSCGVGNAPKERKEVHREITTLTGVSSSLP